MNPERRRHPRYACLLPVRLYPRGELRVIETLTSDLSTGGLRCLSPVPKPIATPVSVELQTGPGEAPFSLRGQVAWFEPVYQSDQFHMGVIFQPLSERDSERLSCYLDKISPLVDASKSA